MNTESDLPNWIFLRQRHFRQTCRHSMPSTSLPALAQTRDGRYLLPYKHLSPRHGDLLLGRAAGDHLGSCQAWNGRRPRQAGPAGCRNGGQGRQAGRSPCGQPGFRCRPVARRAGQRAAVGARAAARGECPRSALHSARHFRQRAAPRERRFVHLCCCSLVQFRCTLDGIGATTAQAGRAHAFGRRGVGGAAKGAVAVARLRPGPRVDQGRPHREALRAFRSPCRRSRLDARQRRRGTLPRGVGRRGDQGRARVARRRHALRCRPPVRSVDAPNGKRPRTRSRRLRGRGSIAAALSWRSTPASSRYRST